ncbi:MAG: hypothetical protein WCD35_07025, partial [Mycobacteriales bacterium]
MLASPEGGRSALLEGLRSEGLAVLVAPAHALLEQVESGAVHLVVLHCDAEAALQDLDLLRRGSQVPVVVALRERASLDRLLEAGADDCVAT